MHAGLLILSTLLGQTTQPVEAPVRSLALFKNGLAVVRRTVPVGEADVYQVRTLPAPVRGTFWIEGDLPVRARVRAATANPPVLASLVGEAVTVHTDRPDGRTVEGVFKHVADFQDAAGVSRRLLTIRTGLGDEHLPLDEVTRLDLADERIGDVQLKPTFELILPPGLEQRPAELAFSYVTAGVYWRPAYRIDLADPETLVLRQQAVVRNRLEPLDDVSVELITGAPNVKFIDELAELFRDVGAAGLVMVDRSLDNSFMGGQLIGGNQGMGGLGGGGGGLGGGGGMPHAGAAAVVPERPEIDGGVTMQNGVDLHYQDVGKLSLAVGEALLLPVVEGSAEYRRLVEWTPQSDSTGDGPVGDADAAWDAVEFRNPLDLPLTTGPVTFTAGPRFQGQATLFFTSPGEQTTLRIAKSLSVTTDVAVALEKSEKKSGGLFFGKEVTERTYRGLLTIHNLRADPTEVVVKRDVTGRLLETPGDPERRGLAEGSAGSEPQTRLSWRFTLAPGEKRELTYRYTTTQ